MLPKINPSQTKAWRQLAFHYKTAGNWQMKTLFDENPNRFDQFSLRFEDILVDYSKNIIQD
jgi:glucose-6-phosphate isomerase